MKEIYIIIILFLLIHYSKSYESFNTNNKFGYKSIIDIPKGIGNVLIDFIMGIIKKPLSIMAPTPLYLTGSKAPSCDNDKEMQAKLCYTKCKKDYSGVGPVCWENCPPGATSMGVACMIKKDKKNIFPKLQAKKTYGRGVGKVPDNCVDPDTYLFGLGCKEYSIFGKIKNRFNVIF